MRFEQIGRFSEVARTWNPRKVELAGTFRYVDIGSIDNQMKIITNVSDMAYAEAPSRARQLVQAGDVLVSTVRPNLNAVAVVPAGLDGATVSTGFCVLRPTSELISRYLFHWVQTPEFVREMTAQATGQSYPAVSDRIVRESYIPLPVSVGEQYAIAEVLDQADALLAKRRRSVVLLDDLAEAIFLDLFGDPSVNQKNWPVVLLDKVITNGPQNGLYKPASSYGTGVPIVRIDAFYRGVITKISSLKRLQVSDLELKRWMLHPGDVLINRVNSLEYLGKSALIPGLSEPTVFESNMMRFSVDNDILHPRFLIQVLQSAHVRSQILSRAKNAVNQSSINQSDVRSLEIFVPLRERQEKYVADLKQIDCLREAALLNTAKLGELFSSLQNRAFRGES